MASKKLKYQELISQFSNCPPSNFVEIEIEAFRWTHIKKHGNDFKPQALINPERFLDSMDEKNCIGLGLSMFNSFQNAVYKYKNHYQKRKNKLKKFFIEDYGESIAKIKLGYDDGVASLPNEQNHGHFTFYEYEFVDLRKT
jgi:hypothetical protein